MPRAKCSFVYPQADGSQGYIRHGELLPVDHPAIAGREALFVAEPDEATEKPAPKPRTRKS